MSGELRYITLYSALGWVGILASAKGLLSITLPRRSAREAQEQLGTKANEAVRSPHHFTDLVARLKTYFSGGRATFPDELDLSGATPFQIKVWAITRVIPYGETRNYRWLAEQIGQPEAARAVGQALARNPLPIIIPCHRVVGSDSKLGGFSGGLEMKRRLLRLEHATIFSRTIYDCQGSPESGSFAR